MYRGDYIWARLVQLRVDRECRFVESSVTFDDVSGLVDENQIVRRYEREVLAEMVHPKALGMLGIAHRDMARGAVVEPEPRQHAVRAREPDLAMVTFGFDGGKCR